MNLFFKLITFSILMFLFGSCKKTTTTAIVAPKEVVGKWKWDYTYLRDYFNESNESNNTSNNRNR